jgi:hypothetical protein
MAASQRRKRDPKRGSTVSSTEPAKRQAASSGAEASAPDETHERAKDAIAERRRPAAEGTGHGRRVAAPAATPSWIAPLAVVLLIVGLLYLVTYYLSSATMPLPIGDWNLLVGFGVLALGGVTLMFWK